VILVDANLLLYAEDSLSPHHATARTWWDGQLSGTSTVCLSWPVITTFIRIGTNPRLHQRPLTLKEAIARVESWLAQPCVRIVDPGDNHWALFSACSPPAAPPAISCPTRIWQRSRWSTIVCCARPTRTSRSFAV